MSLGLITLIAGSVCVVLYAILILLFTINWRKTYRLSDIEDPLPQISVIIPFRNERDRLPALIDALHRQDYPANRFEVVLIDDHSEDHWCQFLATTIERIKNLTLLPNAGIGKKSALKTGILRARGELIMTTDADCIPANSWLITTARAYISEKPALLIGPVRMKSAKSALSQFQSLEFMALQMAGGGAAIMKHPVYCSGANLAFRKDIWLNISQHIGGKQSASGDDVFLLHALKKEGLPIVFLKNNGAMVSTNTEEHLSGFLKQRMRWGGKSRYYTDFSAIFLAVLVMATNLYLALSLLILPWFPHYYAFFAMPFVLKYVIDFSLLKSGESFFSQSIKPLSFLLFSLFYPFYIVVAGTSGLLVTPTWKTEEQKKRN